MSSRREVAEILVLALAILLTAVVFDRAISFFLPQEFTDWKTVFYVAGQRPLQIYDAGEWQHAYNNAPWLAWLLVPFSMFSVAGGLALWLTPLHFSNHLGIKTRRARSVYYATGFVFARFFPSGSPWSGGCFYLFGVCAAARTVTASPAAWSIVDGDETTGVRFWGAGASGTQPTAVVDHCAYGRINPHHLYFLWVLAHSYFAK